jgi:hypothetical protein
VKSATFGVFVFIAAALIGLAGCSDSETTIERTVRAGGIVTHQGQPLPYYQVMFHPDDGRRPAAGVSDAQGKFVLGTNGEGDGAPAGKHRVSITYVGPPSAGADGMNNFSPPPPPKTKLAPKYGNAETSGLTAEVPASGSSELKLEVP